MGKSSFKQKSLELRAWSLELKTEFLKMLACDFLLKLLLKNCDFVPLLTKTGQVPILGFLEHFGSQEYWQKFLLSRRALS